jgi:hypothetical protein
LVWSPTLHTPVFGFLELVGVTPHRWLTGGMSTSANTTPIKPARGRTAAIAAALLALAAVLAALALPLTASAGTGRCPSGAFCIWKHSSYKGPKYVTYGSQRDLTGATYRGTNIPVAGTGSSFVNNGRPGRKSAVRLFYLAFPGSDTPSVCITRLGRAVNLDFWPIDDLEDAVWNDNIVGLRWEAGC